ncbi:hypothetical protein SISSUDRAFT_1121422 [Sistotremastrum suecicum HHB10207 ss-3]|uniref:Uncharacterized protein n=1 Tax=Sistotremastrum suecicum HHB10207 ss-3 TaxID=1314776 RepID=A0A166AVH8_9AGAM|nr:hypothetical protein SISSUDRAFT_1121422 [Sistotremastrum suecicum HHB10207 ss-3]
MSGRKETSSLIADDTGVRAYAGRLAVATLKAGDYTAFFESWESLEESTDPSLIQDAAWPAMQVLEELIRLGQVPPEWLEKSHTVLFNFTLQTINCLDEFGRGNGKRDADVACRDIAMALCLLEENGVKLFEGCLLPRLQSMSLIGKRRVIPKVVRAIAENWLANDLTSDTRERILRGITLIISNNSSSTTSSSSASQSSLLSYIPTTTHLLSTCSALNDELLGSCILAEALRDPEIDLKTDATVWLIPLQQSLARDKFNFEFKPFNEFWVARVHHFAMDLPPVPQVLKGFEFYGDGSSKANKTVIGQIRALGASNSQIKKVKSWLCRRSQILILARALEALPSRMAALGPRFEVFRCEPYEVDVAPVEAPAPPEATPPPLASSSSLPPPYSPPPTEAPEPSTPPSHKRKELDDAPQSTSFMGWLSRSVRQRLF